MFEEYDIVAGPGVSKDFFYEIIRAVGFLKDKTGLEINKQIIIHNESGEPGFYDSEDDTIYISENGTIKRMKEKNCSQIFKAAICEILILFYLSKYKDHNEEKASKFAMDTIKQLNEELRYY